MTSDWKVRPNTAKAGWKFQIEVQTKGRSMFISRSENPWQWHKISCRHIWSFLCLLSPGKLWLLFPDIKNHFYQAIPTSTLEQHAHQNPGCFCVACNRCLQSMYFDLYFATGRLFATGFATYILCDLITWWSWWKQQPRNPVFTAEQSLGPSQKNSTIFRRS